MFDRLISYLKESKAELKKVAWPTREETIRYTATVLLISAAVGIYLGGLDYVFQYVLDVFVL